MTDAILAEGLVKRYKRRHGARRASTCGCRRARCWRCSGPTAPARPPPSGSSPRCSPPTRGGPRSPASTSLADPRGGAPQDRAVRAVRRRRRVPHRLREPRHGRPALPPGPPRAAASGRASCSTQFGLDEAADRPVEDLLRRHAPPARPGRRAGRRPAGAVPRRADDRASTRAAAPRCGTCIQELVAGGTTLLLTTQYLEEADLLADNDRRHRPRPGDRRGHRRRAEGPGRRRAARDHRRRTPGRCSAARELLEPLGGRRPVVDRGAPPVAAGAGHRRRRGPGRGAAPARRRRDRASRRRAAPAHARRRVPHPDRPRRRGATPPRRPGSGGPRAPRRSDERRPRRDRRPRRRQAQPDQDQAGPRPAGLHDDVADHVHPAVRLRLRRRDRPGRRRRRPTGSS